jgi:hypothetical protein
MIWSIWAIWAAWTHNEIDPAAMIWSARTHNEIDPAMIWSAWTTMRSTRTLSSRATLL